MLPAEYSDPTGKLPSLISRREFWCETFRKLTQAAVRIMQSTPRTQFFLCIVLYCIDATPIGDPPGMNPQTEPSGKNAQQVEKMQVSALVGKDLSFFQAAVDHVVPPAFNVEPQRSGHDQENNLAISKRNVKYLDVTLKFPL